MLCEARTRAAGGALAPRGSCSRQMHAHLRAAKRPADATRHVESAATTSRRLCGEHVRGVTPGLPPAPGVQKRAHTIIARGSRTCAARPDERCAEMCATSASLCTMPDIAVFVENLTERVKGVAETRVSQVSLFCFSCVSSVFLRCL